MTQQFHSQKFPPEKYAHMLLEDTMMLRAALSVIAPMERMQMFIRERMDK